VDAAIGKLFGQRVRELREQQELSQEAFADKVGLDRTYVSGIERGTRNPTLATMQRIAKGLSVTVERLVKGL
jgi:transcriptional regulator with XRE-family HTH domain